MPTCFSPSSPSLLSLILYIYIKKEEKVRVYPWDIRETGDFLVGGLCGGLWKKGGGGGVVLQKSGLYFIRQG
jgi:hypothetical protein